MSLQKTTAQKKIAKLRKRVRIVQGGTSSSKTFTILPLLIQYAISNPGAEISIVSESVPHLKRGAIRDFQKIMVWSGNWRDENFNKAELTYTYSNASRIEFFSADQPDKLRGARRDVLFVNECNNVLFESYHQLAIRTRKFIYLDYNPTNEFWVHKELVGDPDADLIILTYKDNEALDESLVREIEKNRKKGFFDEKLPTFSEDKNTPKLFDEANIKSAYWSNWWRVYGLGQTGSLEGVVFSNWGTTPTVPSDARLIGYGLDFGYSNDPTAIVAVYQWNDYRILDEICYQTQMLNTDIVRYLPQGVKVYADSAEPKSIEEIKRAGRLIFPAKKGKDSINYGVQLMQNQNYLITSRSTNLIKEFREYAWDKNKDGDKVNKPAEGQQDHIIDATRYHEMMTLGAKKIYVI